MGRRFNMRELQFPKLFQPGYIGNLELRNRIVMAPMGAGFAELDGRISQRQIDYYAARAKGGVGLIILESSRIERVLEPAWTFALPALDSDTLIAGAADLVDAVHDYEAKICFQLNLGLGRYVDWASPQRIPISASALPAFLNPDVLCRPLTVEEIARMVQAAADSARRAVVAGFDMIEIHAHTGYLIDQFMSSLWNKRTDEYGGDLDGRLRFTLEVIRATRAVVGPDFPLSFRFSADHKIEEGRSMEEAQEIARRVEAEGINVLHVDAGSYEAQPWIFPPNYWPQGCMVDLAEAVKQVVSIPMIAVGSINRPELAEQIINEGKADFVCLGRQLIADPDWPNKAKYGQVEDIRPCIRCNEICIGRLYSFKAISCSVNPTVGKERYYVINRAERPKKVMVIGGGPAGMEAARVAVLRGHEIVLYEKDNELGGKLRTAAGYTFKGAIQSLVEHLSAQLKKLGVKVEAGKEVTPDLIDKVRPDAVVVAAGATPLIPSIPGVNNENIITALDLHLNKRKTGETVVVAGGGLVGSESALSLAQEGKKVTIVEMLPDIACDMNVVSRMALLKELADIGVETLTDMTIKEFTGEGLVVTDKEGKEQVLRAGTIVLALGSKPEDRLVKELRDKVDELYVAGDCADPRKIGSAVHEGFAAGWQI